MSDTEQQKVRRQIQWLIGFFISSLVVSGLTAFPIEWQLSLANRWITSLPNENALTRWLKLAYQGVHETNNKFPFIAYGTDWLAFAHLVIAVAFIGPLKDPVKNVWVIEFGLIACVAVFPLALIAGSVRGIPFYWRLIDCSFGLLGGSLLWVCHSKIKQLEKSNFVGI